MSFHFIRPVAMVAAGLAGFALDIGSAAAQTAPSTNVYLQLGAGQNTQSYVVGFSRPFNWRYAVGNGQLKAYWEVEIGGWKGSVPDDRWYAQAGITPVLRYDWTTGGPLFMEAGIGANVITPHFAHGHHSRFATRFQFGDHLGVGWYLGDTHADEISLRIQHYSNGGYKQPNPGVNFVQLRYSHGF